MLDTLDLNSMADLKKSVIDSSLVSNTTPKLDFEQVPTDKVLKEFSEVLNKNENFKSFIGEGFY